ncbi:MAG: hypothetical protein NVS3B3_22320 [Aquirhabdus sp.]
MSRVITLLVSLTIAILSTGCSLMAPKYDASQNNIQALKDAGNYSAKVGEFDSKNDPKNVNPISIRGSSLASPYQGSYANYLSEAIKQELTLATKFVPNANLEISGTLLKNDIDAAGFSVGVVTIEARFVVKRDGKITYDQLKSIKSEFPSSFAGNVAIPRAVQEYSPAVQKLLASLYADKAFIDALK